MTSGRLPSRSWIRVFRVGADPVEEQGCGPVVADALEQCLVATVGHVQVGQTQWRQSRYEVAVQVFRVVLGNVVEGVSR
jgi:hypothetical protein